MSFKQIATLARKDSTESKLERMLVSSLPSDLQVQVRNSTNVRDSLIQAVKNGQVQQSNEQLVACLQELGGNVMEIKNMASMIMDLLSKNYKLTSDNNELLTHVSQLQKELASKQDEMKVLQIQALDRLALLQKSVKALLTQTYELHEYPIPRLFIVLPQDTSSRNPLDHLTHKFRLYFLCECGEHTKSINTKIPHHIHLAKHEGYELARPTEFFQRYGPYVLTILQMLKYGLTVAGVAVPALTQLIRPDDVEKVNEGLKLLTNTLEPGVNQVIEYIEKVTAEQGQAVVELSEQMDSNEALEGADLRQLESFLKTKDEHRVLGNLYRTVTGEGHVKWVCIDHYRENYHEKAAIAFRDAVAVLDGLFDENVGRVEVKLTSKVQADQFYQNLEKARSVYELEIELDWETTQGDFKRLRNALSKTSVGVLELRLRDTDGPTSDRLNRSQRYDPIIGIMRHPSIQSFKIRGPQNFSKRSGLLSRDDEFPNLRHLDVALNQWENDIPAVNCLITKCPNLSSLALGRDGWKSRDLQQTFNDLILPPTLRRLDIPLRQWDGYTADATYIICKAWNVPSLTVGAGLKGEDNRFFLEAYNAIAEHRTYPLVLTDWDFCFPPPPTKESNQAMATEQYLGRLLDCYWKCNDSTLDVADLDESTADAIAKATMNGSRFTAFYLRGGGQLDDSFVNNISSIVGRSELDILSIQMQKDERRVRMLESIQWKHLRSLWVVLTPGALETRVMRVLVDGVTKMSGKVELEEFWFVSETEGTPLTLPDDDLLLAFVASMALEKLHLDAVIPFERILSLCLSMDVSRLEILKLWTDGIDSVKVDAILDGLRHATNLSDLYLVKANITKEQISRMSAKGITLKNT
ncbi:hypothetical protein BGX34_003074, partial [Mortierella sp. NVP85]